MCGVVRELLKKVYGLAGLSASSTVFTQNTETLLEQS